MHFQGHLEARVANLFRICGLRYFAQTEIYEFWNFFKDSMKFGLLGLEASKRWD